jgi:hypothetical protein
MGKPITVAIPHQLGRAEARRRIEEGFSRLAAQLGGGLAQVHKSWSGDQLQFAARALGQSLSGRLDVLDDQVRMELDLPPFLALIADRIRGRVQTEGRLLLEKK